MKARGHTGEEEGYTTLAPSVVMAAHELKTPLVLIRQLALGLESAESVNELTQKIIVSSERALRLTSDITKSARLQDSLFESEICDAYALCTEVVREISPLYNAQSRTIRVARKRHAASLSVVANRDLLRRTLLSFSDAALRQTPQSMPVEITLEHREKAGLVRFMVRDFGPGMPTQFWRQVRNAMRRELRTSSNSVAQQSSSLGISLAVQFASAMNGTAGVIRHKDGTTLYVDMPASTQMKLL